MKQPQLRILSLSMSLALVTSGLLSACGGGGDSAPIAAAPTATVSGVAATGAAIVAGQVTLNCLSGKTGIATTGNDGSFAVNLTGVTLPCIGRVDYKDILGAAQKLQTFISAAGTANINPVTDLLVASLTGGKAADAFDKFDPTKVKGYTPAQVKAATDTVKTFLKTSLGVDTANLPDDLVTTKLVAKAGLTDGDKVDKVLDDLKVKLIAAGIKLNDAADRIVGLQR